MPQTDCGFVDGAAGTGRDMLVRHGPTLFVDIGFDPTFQPANPAAPVAGVTQVYALVDTGATESCIDDQLAVNLNLPIIDRRQIGGVGGRHTVNVYLAQIHVPALAFTQYGGFAGVDLAAGGQTHQALIGRTFLWHFTMIYDGLTGGVRLIQ